MSEGVVLVVVLVLGPCLLGGSGSGSGTVREWLFPTMSVVGEERAGQQVETAATRRKYA